jgi:hypothetical protein
MSIIFLDSHQARIDKNDGEGLDSRTYGSRMTTEMGSQCGSRMTAELDYL